MSSESVGAVKRLDRDDDKSSDATAWVTTVLVYDTLTGFEDNVLWLSFVTFAASRSKVGRGQAVYGAKLCVVIWVDGRRRGLQCHYRNCKLSSYWLTESACNFFPPWSIIHSALLTMTESDKVILALSFSSMRLVRLRGAPVCVWAGVRARVSAASLSLWRFSTNRVLFSLSESHQYFMGRLNGDKRRRFVCDFRFSCRYFG